MLSNDPNSYFFPRVDLTQAENTNMDIYSLIVSINVLIIFIVSKKKPSMCLLEVNKDWV